MLASRKIFLGSSTLVTALVLNILGSLTTDKAAKLMSSGIAMDSTGGLTMSVGDPAAMAGQIQQAAKLLRVVEVAGSLALILGTVGILLVLTGLYQLAVLVESGQTRPDSPDRSPGSPP